MVGNAKNAGKTTVLNALVAAHAGMPLGISSIGLDGEEVDSVSFLPKPRVALPVGTLAASAEDCLAVSDAGWEMLSQTGMRTGLGEVIIVRVTRPGHVLLAGPSTAAGMEQVMAQMTRLGAGKLLIDGAFARQSHAMAGEAMVFVVGAHLSDKMEKVVENAGLALKCFALPQAEARHSFLLKENRPGWLDAEDGFHALLMTTPLGQAEALLDAVPPEARWLYLPGALDSALAQAMVSRRKGHSFGLILASPLNLVMRDDVLRRLFRLGRDIRVLRPLKVAFVAMNPVSPAGHAFDPSAFRAALAGVSDLPLIDVLEEQRR